MPSCEIHSPRGIPLELSSAGGRKESTSGGAIGCQAYLTDANSIDLHGICLRGDSWDSRSLLCSVLCSAPALPAACLLCLLLACWLAQMLTQSLSACLPACCLLCLLLSDASWLPPGLSAVTRSLQLDPNLPSPNSQASNHNVCS